MIGERGRPATGGTVPTCGPEMDPNQHRDPPRRTGDLTQRRTVGDTGYAPTWNESMYSTGIQPRRTADPNAADTFSLLARASAGV
jgi:hypothetical protein